LGTKLEKVGIREGARLQREKPKKETERKKEINKTEEPKGDILKGIYQGSNGTLTLKDDSIELNARGTLGAWKANEEIKYSDITNIKLSKDMIKDSLEVKYKGGDDLYFSHFDRNTGKLFVEKIRERIQSTSTPQTTLSPMDEIKKAKELLDIGAITQEQFEEIRDKYLGSL
jgi:hypothetical protein